MKLLITGGAGFIGQHVCRLLVHDHEIRVLDSFEEIVHGPVPCGNEVKKLFDIGGVAEMVTGRIEDLGTVCDVINGCDAVIHLAAGVSVDASFAEPSRFVRTNSLGTAVLLEAIRKTKTVKHLIVASSMSVYGAGHAHRGMYENDPCRPASFYGASKYHSEQLCLMAGRLYGIRVAALRLWNTYGPGQSLHNAETGVVAIFAARLLAGQPPQIYEDGQQVRDFVAVSDVAEAFKRALDSQISGIFNIGSGYRTTVLDVAETLCTLLTRAKINPDITYQQRPGDIRHCWPNITRARAVLAWRPKIDLHAGLTHYANWLRSRETKSLEPRNCGISSDK
jgi:dTDP-L-rhamnose 4-epimerase